MSIAEIETKIYHEILKEGMEKVREELLKQDKEIAEARDRGRYRHKGYGKSCIKTIMGPVEFQRRRYYDTEEKEYVYLLDEELEMEGFGKVSPLMAVTAVKLTAESTFRNAARQVEDLTGLSISHQAVWDVTQTVGQRLKAAESEKGTRETKILFEEADGIWLRLQGEDRKKHGDTHEMKIAIAYDGVEVNGKRRSCHGKIACAGFYESEDFREKSEEMVRETYDTDKIELRVLNGDGASWIFNRDEDVVTQLDVYHRNKAVVANIKEPEIRKAILKQLYKKDIDGVMEMIEAAYNSTDDEKEQEGIQNLLTYFKNNRERLVQYTRRGIKLPEINEELKYAKLGAMESNVFSLIGNRMKGRRKCWSISGGDNMATILCLKHTGRLDKALRAIRLPVIEKEVHRAEQTELNVSEVPRDETIGKGYNGFRNSSLQGYEWLRKIADYNMLEMHT